MNTIISSNVNRVAILHLLKNSHKNEMQAEKIAQSTGLTHRTVLYHLNILEKNGLVEVRKYRKKGEKLLRSVWGLDKKNTELVENLFSKMNGDLNLEELNAMINRNIARR
jgi:DNA-binding transcriptional ArsR family regulator